MEGLNYAARINAEKMDMFTAKFELGNSGIFTIYMPVRQLEFSLLQLILQVDELIAAFQCILGGRFPMTENPLDLYNVLRNVFTVTGEPRANSWNKME